MPQRTVSSRPLPVPSSRDDSTAMPPEDDTAIALSEDTAARYEAYGWHVQIVEGGEVAAVKKAATFPPAGPTS